MITGNELCPQLADQRAHLISFLRRSGISMRFVGLTEILDDEGTIDPARCGFNGYQCEFLSADADVLAVSSVINGEGITLFYQDTSDYPPQLSIHALRLQRIMRACNYDFTHPALQPLRDAISQQH